MAEYPPYVANRGGDPSWQPFACNHTQMYGFFVPADGTAIQRTVDRCLNAPTSGACDYRALSSHVLVTFAETQHLTPTTQPAQGWCPERSAAVWVFAAACKRELGIDVAQRLVSFPAYVFVDIDWSLVMGREIYGFPKQMGPIALPEWRGPIGRMTATTTVLPVFRSTEQSRSDVVLAVERIADSTEPAATWNTIEDARRFVVGRFHAGAHVVIPGLSFFEDLFELASQHEVPCAFLKQFRDVADGTRACYQAVTEAPMQVTAFHEGGLLHGDFEVTVSDYASCRIQQDLGLGSTTVPVTAAFYIDFDFTSDAGREVWKWQPAAHR
jgi:hypothetical protein